MIRFSGIAVLAAGALLVASAAEAIDLTSAGHLSPAQSTNMEQTRLARYLTILPFQTGQTVRWTHYGTTASYPGSYDIAVYPDGEEDGFGLCDGFVSAVSNQDQAGTKGWGEASGDYQGYRFKHKVTVSQINWTNIVWKKGGTFAATPEVQVLNTPLELGGTWSTVTASWDTPYDATFDNTNLYARPYAITLVDGAGQPDPVEDVWGIRLFGVCAASSLDATGFVDTCELQVSGECSLTSQVGLSNNLALNQTPIWSRAPVYDQDPKVYSGTAANFNLLTDGIYGENGCDGRTADPTDTTGTTDFVGVKFDTAQKDVTAVGITMYYNAHPDEEYQNGSGYLQQDTIKVQYTTDPALDPNAPSLSTWIDVTGLDLGRLPEMESELQATLIANGQSRYVHTELLTFEAIEANITGIRMLGTPEPLAGLDSAIDLTGYLDVQEFEVFALPGVAPPRIPGDTNGNQIVDAEDAKVVAGNWGRTDITGGFEDGDFNGDHAVNAADASILAANWGNHTEGAGEGSVPEPSVAVLLLGAALAVVARRVRR